MMRVCRCLIADIVDAQRQLSHVVARGELEKAPPMEIRGHQRLIGRRRTARRRQNDITRNIEL